jgi:endonuclease/exonuclease/phosphatase family metal-dependent hydrolase
MKKISYGMLLVAMALAACTKDAFLAQDDNGIKEMQSFTVIGSQGNDTRVVFTDPGDGGNIQIDWDSKPENEQLSLWGQRTDDDNWKMVGELTGKERINGQTMSFAGKKEYEAELKYRFLYPRLNTAAQEVDFSGQVQDCDHPMDHLSAYNVMQSEALTTYDAPFLLKHACTMLKFVLTLPKATEISGITLTDQSGPAFYSSLTVGSNGQWEVANPTNKYVLVLDNHDGSNRVTAYMMVPIGDVPLSLANQTLSVTAVATDGTTYADDGVVLGNGQTLEPGAYYTLTRTLKSVTSTAETDLRVMSFNIRIFTNNDKGDKHWDKRKGAIVAMIAEQKPTVIGVQESNKYEQQQMYLADNTGYDCISVGRESGGIGKDDEAVPIYYDTKKVVLNDWGYFWLSDTPQKTSHIEGSMFRVVTWGCFTDKQNLYRFYVVNVHLDNSNDQVRKKQAELLMKIFGDINTKGLPVISVGDFNTVDKEVLSPITNDGYKDARLEAPVTDDGITYNDWGGSNQKLIDFVLYTPQRLQPTKYQVVTKAYAGITYISDHYPIQVDFKLK